MPSKIPSLEIEVESYGETSAAAKSIADFSDANGKVRLEASIGDYGDFASITMSKKSVEQLAAWLNNMAAQRISVFK